MRKGNYPSSSPFPGPYDFISVKEAVRRGYASRHTLMRWARDGSVRSFVRGRNRYVSEGDVRARIALRQAGKHSITDEELTDRLAEEIVSAMPALNDAQLDRLAGLFTDGRRAR